MIVDLALFAQLAAACAPGAAPETLASVARTESGFEAYAIHDNSSGRVLRPGTREEAIAQATELIVVRGHSVDLGLMQVNSANFARLGLTIGDAFEPCHSLAAGARVLAEGYARADPGRGAQRALREALSRYNTGSPAQGFANGYVGRVEAAAVQVVPALRLEEETAASPAPVPVPAAPAPPPAWDVFAQAAAAPQLVFSPSPPAPSPAPRKVPSRSGPDTEAALHGPTRTAAR